MLYPVSNDKRVAISLNGLWDFQFVGDDYTPTNKLEHPSLMSVPSSYNDIFTTYEEREYLGLVAYEKTIFIPSSFSVQSWHIRLGAAAHLAKVYIDGIQVAFHSSGFLPFDFEVPSTSFRLTILLDNRLNYQTLPIATLTKDEDGHKINTHFDFFNYGGLHRNVFLYSLPKNPIRDITIKTSLKNHQAIIDYHVESDDTNCLVEVIDPNHMSVANHINLKGSIIIDNPILWDINQGNLYTLKVITTNDTYSEPFGIREIKIEGANILLNGKPIYLKGFGMHEDHITLGKGSNSALNLRDFQLLKWIGANSFRTSHYPYDEEMYRLADQFGILIIDEIPAVGMNFWNKTKVFSDDIINQKTREIHKQQFSELVKRDKNHPSVILYSLANEANTYEDGAYPYFKDVFDHARKCTDLPLMIVENVTAKENKVAQLADVIGVNRYFGWYLDMGDLKISRTKLKQDLLDYNDKFKKPLIVTEFGTDTISGLHSIPSVAFSEEYQLDFIKMYKEVFKELDFVVGEHIWNFADFMTKQMIGRVNGNKKGVFTRERTPKLVAHFLREKWHIK